MARTDKARHRISYVLPLSNSSGGHRLGVNGLAVDKERSILYSGGRDGVICTWDFAAGCRASQPLTPAVNDAPVRERSKSQPSRAWHAPVQAHTHWINDIVLAQSNSALITASSDLTVKLWRPHSENRSLPQTIGFHSDYVKCLATSKSQPNWVASGGLDHKIRLWDLNGGGEVLQISVGEEDRIAKGSVYALGVGGSILAGGGPECIVRVWDPRSGKRVTKLVGHTDNIRGILVSDHGDVVMTASSDQTIKVWSISAGRCIYTLTMHNDSVWSLYSDHPRLSVFYSGDRSGLVAKTSVLRTSDMDQGVCIAVCQEHDGVNKVIGDESNIWTATANSSINRWPNINIDVGSKLTGPASQHHNWNFISHPRQPQSPPSVKPTVKSDEDGKRIPINSILRLSNTALFPTHLLPDRDGFTHLRQGSEALIDTGPHSVTPVQDLPQESIEGQNGLIKHILLNDRRRVLTLDTAGEVMMWDLVQCEPVHSYGKRHLEDVAPEVNTVESIANWCTVNTRTGELACILEENLCFDGEVYADELPISGTVDFKDDQRINLGRWVLRYLFSALIDEEIRRDETYRRELSNTHLMETTGIPRAISPTSIQLPKSPLIGWPDFANDMSGITPRPMAGFSYGPLTPGLTIGCATPGIQPGQTTQVDNQPVTPGDSSVSEKLTYQNSQTRSLSDMNNDYFSTGPELQAQVASNENTTNPMVPNEGQDDRSSQGTAEPDKDTTSKESSTRFGKKFRLSFSGKKLGRAPATNANKPPVIDEKAEESDDSRSSDTREFAPLDNFFGVVQIIRQEYHAQATDNLGQVPPSGINPSLPRETPVLKIPPLTTIIIQEDRPESGAVSDLYRGTVASTGKDADLIEQVAPMWLGELLLKNQLPHKDTVKVSFVLQPYDDFLPSLPSADGNGRLNANRMLRVKKILAYVAERIEPRPEEPDPNAMQPEEYLELYCQNQLLSTTMTLATLRAHIWKGGGDVMLYYKSNGKKKIANVRERIGHFSISDATEADYSSQ